MVIVFVFVELAFMNEEHYIDGEHNGGVYNSGNNNPYTYCYHNPVRYVDPNGKQVDIVDFIPFAGSGRDIFRGIRDGDTVMLTIGIVGLAADVYTLGGASVAKGIIKAGAEEIVEVGVKQAVKKSLTKAEQIILNKSIGKAFEKSVSKELIETYGKQNVKTQITARFADGTAVVFDDVILDGSKITAINESKSGAAKLTKQQARFFDNGEAVTFVGKKAKEAGILGKQIKAEAVKILKNGN